MRHSFFLAVLLFPTLLMADINPTRISGSDSKTSATVTVIVHVTFVDSPISSEMSIEEIEATTEGRCSVNPENPTEVLCQ